MNPFAQQPTAPQAASGGPLVFTVPEDPNWEPIDFDDVLSQNGFYIGRITEEKYQEANSRVIIRFALQDDDAGGKTVSKFMDLDPKKLFLWRQLAMSISGSKDAGKAGFTYTPGQFVGAIAYLKLGSYEDKKSGDLRTGIDAMVTELEYKAAHASGKGRWPAVVSKPSAVSNPTGMPAGFPGLGGVKSGLSAPTNSIPQPAPNLSGAVNALTPSNVPPVAAPPPSVPQPQSGGFKFPGMK